MVPAVVWNSSVLSATFLRSSVHRQRVSSTRFEFRTLLPRDQPGGYTGEDSSAISRPRHIDAHRGGIRLLPICDTGFRCSLLVSQSAHGYWLLARPIHFLGMARSYYLGADLGTGIGALLQYVFASLRRALAVA